MGLTVHTALIHPIAQVTNLEKQLDFDAQCVSLIAIKKASYIFTDKFAVNVEEVKNKFICTMLFKKDIDEADMEDIAIDFRNEILDQELREEISQKTEPVKNLILAFAFSKSGLTDDE